ncbi:hypothetical protein KIPB_005277 [Kipferlia bialata]|uniref:Uncharacterized protein n=1 Tax=Kipferlia bialata TaxID=797122 RepID=A0A9K3GH72_9EUKA|nr:hypothetical protein KIPB_005277 [Kipferlia bialata]|eukprot:g5277.t1
MNTLLSVVLVCLVGLTLAHPVDEGMDDRCSVYGPALDQGDTGMVMTYSIEALNHLISGFMPFFQESLYLFTVPDMDGSVDLGCV